MSGNPTGRVGLTTPATGAARAAQPPSSARRVEPAGPPPGTASTATGPTSRFAATRTSGAATSASTSAASTSRPSFGASNRPAAGGSGPGRSAYGATTSKGLDVRKAISSYFDRMISAVQGMKVVLFDEEAKEVVAMVYTQSQILEKSVFLTASLIPKKMQQLQYDRAGLDEGADSGVKKREKMPHLKGLILCRPIEQNIDMIVKELDDPLYGEYHLFFTTPVSPQILTKIAQFDRNSVVKQVQEFYCDYLAINNDFFDFGLEGYLRLSRSRQKWNGFMESTFRRSIQQTMAVLLSLRQKPTIRYQAGSELAMHFARELSHEMDRERALFEFGNAAPPSNSSGETLFLVLDRREDPISPLLLQWTYQAMVHELLGSGLKHNLVDLGDEYIKRNPDEDADSDPRKRMERKQVVLSQSDEFYLKNMFKDYGLLASNTKKMLDDYKDKVAQNKNISSIEDMTRVIESMPEFKKLANNALKHAAVVGEITRVMGQRNLIDVSTLEQQLACSSDHATHIEKVKEKLRDPKISADDKLRLALLYTLRYETHGGNRIAELKQLLKASKGIEDRVRLLDLILEYAGTTKRTKETLFGTGSDLFSGIVTMVKGAAATGVENVLTQHKPMLAKVLEEARTGRLSENKFPSASATPGPSPSPPLSSTGSSAGTPNCAPPAREVIVLILGGATYEEACYVATLNSATNISSGPNSFEVLLGGTSVLNTKTFLTDLGSLTM